jgi:RNA recognition motif-containing protein
VGKKLYVGNISFKMTDVDLKDLFTGAGTVVDAKIIVDRETQRSRGFGFVTMDTEENAVEAIKRFHDEEVGGRRLMVNEAREKAPFDGNAPRNNRY